MERYRKRLIAGSGLVSVGLLAEVIMLSARPPVWLWGFLLLIGIGGGVIVSAFRAAGRDRRDRTLRALRGDGEDTSQP